MKLDSTIFFIADKRIGGEFRSMAMGTQMCQATVIDAAPRRPLQSIFFGANGLDEIGHHKAERLHWDLAGRSSSW